MPQAAQKAKAHGPVDAEFIFGAFMAEGHTLNPTAKAEKQDFNLICCLVLPIALCALRNVARLRPAAGSPLESVK